MKILICEDEEIMLTALEFRLRKQGFVVSKAEDGKEAIEQIKLEKPDIIIADIMMPHVSGLELVQFVREDLEDPTTPIIIISALEYDDIVLEAFRLGANDFIAKPFKPNELILRIKRIVQEQEIEQEIGS
jgi:DNA-binding response OmpR family regulator